MDAHADNAGAGAFAHSPMKDWLGQPVDRDVSQDPGAGQFLTRAPQVVRPAHDEAPMIPSRGSSARKLQRTRKALAPREPR